MMKESAVAARYRRYAGRDFKDSSPTYWRLAIALAEDRQIMEWLASRPFAEQQPLLLFAAVRALGGPVDEPARFRSFVHDRQAEVEQVLATHSTQTNEIARCASLVLAVAQVPGPIALIEVGASAGLCLLMDRVHYEYPGVGSTGDPTSPVQLRCDCIGPVPPPVPSRLPHIVWRRGIDLNPVDVHDDERVRWLECCVWPEHADRLDRLRAAIELARDNPPTVLQGDASEMVAGVIDSAPRHATVIVMHSAVMPYLPRESQSRVADAVETSGARWVSLEGSGIVPGATSPPELEGLPGSDHFVLAVDRRPLALAQAHGRWLRWL